MNTPTLETKRLILRKFTESKEDIEALYRIYSDKEVNTFLPLFPFETIEDAKAYYQSNLASDYAKKDAYNYAICLKEDNIPIGYIHAGTSDAFDLGYGLCKEYWHQGIVTEAGMAVIEQLKKDGYLFITATHDVKNPKSGAVMRRLGMRYQYSYDELWQPKNYQVTMRMYQLNFDGNDTRVYKKYWDMFEPHFVEKDVE